MGTYYLLLTTYHLPTTYCSLLHIHYSLLTTYYLLPLPLLYYYYYYHTTMCIAAPGHTHTCTHPSSVARYTNQQRTSRPIDRRELLRNLTFAARRAKKRKTSI